MNVNELKAKYLNSDFRLKSEFQGSNYAREETLNRCERYAGWTLPTLFPDDPLMEYDEMQNDFQSVGAQAVINLANKIMLALFQPSRPFFRMNLTEEQMKGIKQTTGMDDAKIDEALSGAEREAMRELEKLNARVALTDVIQHLIITGNCLLFMPPAEKMQVFSLRDYVVTRDLRGNLVKCIYREQKAVSGLSDELAAIVQSNGYDEEDEVTLYTAICRVGEDKFVVWQELEDLCYCHKKIGVYKEEDLQWIPLTWNLCRGKDYGTGLVENYAGDFHTLSTLAEAILDFTTVLTDVKNLVDPASMIDVRTLNESPSGAYVYGREGDVFVHSPDVQKNAEFLTERFQQVERRIGAAFLLNSSVTRDAERVTAEEIRRQAHELESSLGGVYSRLAVELQLPLARSLLKKQNEVFKDVEPIIITGLESLSRTSELDRIRSFLNDLIILSDVPDSVSIRLDTGNLIAKLGAGHGVDYKDFLKDEKQVESDIEERNKRNAIAAGQEAQAVEAAKGTPNGQ